MEQLNAYITKIIFFKQAMNEKHVYQYINLLESYPKPHWKWKASKSLKHNTITNVASPYEPDWS